MTQQPPKRTLIAGDEPNSICSFRRSACAESLQSEQQVRKLDAIVRFGEVFAYLSFNPALLSPETRPNAAP
jgi:hypothetical protein